MTSTGDRRPIASRDTTWAKATAARLVALGATPNGVSQASMAAGAIAGIAFFGAGHSEGVARVALLLAGALFCQIRLLCNLFDGMIALEGGRAGPDGPFWNEFPDRVADLLIFVGIGFGIASPALGWAAAALAILTAYVRELGRAVGAPADFAGPMAKQHRMAVVTAAALIATAEPVFAAPGTVLALALWIILAGSAATVIRRSHRLVRQLKARTGP